MRNYVFFFGALAGSIIARDASASALLKPISGPVQVLRPRALDIETRIDGAWAQTTVTTLYARNGKQALEADLLYTAPQGSIVTGVAYWHGKERVVARVTERERAEKISQSSQSGEIDPAWVQLVGKNVFRVRLHSIMPRRDLRVEVKLAQPLRGEGSAAAWKYPLVSETRDVTLDWLRVRTAVPNGFVARNNYGASVAQEELTLKKYNFKPRSDLRVALPSSGGGLEAQLTTEHVAQGDGQAGNDAYFALTLRSEKDIDETPVIQGIEIFDLLPAKRANGGEVQLFGRYRGKGDATVKWGKQQVSVWFPPASNAVNEVQRLAAPLWGMGKLESVVGDGQERARSITLSKRFNILSKWTSYVAIPEKERAVFEARLQQIDLRKRGADWGRAWAVQIEEGTPLSAKALEARARLRALTRSSLGRKFAFDEENVRAESVKARLAQLARLVMAGQMGIRDKDASAETRMSRIAGFALEDVAPYLQTAQRNLRARQIEKVAQNWTRQVVSLRGNTPNARRLKKQLDALQSRYGNREDYENAAWRRGAQQMAIAAFAEATAGRENGPRATQLIDAGERFARRCGAGSFRARFYQPTIESSLKQAGEQLINEIEAGRAQSEAARGAEVQIGRLYALAPQLRSTLRSRGSLEWQMDVARRGLARETAYRLVQTRAQRPDDQKTLSAFENQLNEIASRTEKEPADFINAETARLQKGEALRSAHEFRLKLNGIDPENEQNDALPTRNEPRLAVPNDEPLLSVRLPSGTRHVEAVLPSGETQDLIWNSQGSLWQGRLYSPHFLRTERLIVGLRVVDSAGRATRFNFNFTFDDAKDAASKVWNVGVWSATKTQSVSLVLPWREKIELPVKASGQFAAPVAVPARWADKKGLLHLLIVGPTKNLTDILLEWK